MINYIKEVIKKYHPIFIISALMLLSVEWLNHPHEFLSWLVQHLPLFLFNYILYVSIFILLFHIVRKLLIASLIFTILMGALAISNYYKIFFKGEHFVIWDLWNASAAMGVASDLKIPITIGVIATVLLVIGCNVYAFKKRTVLNSKALSKKSFALTTLSVSVLYVAIIVPNAFMNQYSYQPSLNYEENGFLPALINDIRHSFVVEPKDYDQDIIQDIVSQYPPNEKATTIKPNIVVIMNEAFSDLNDIDPSLTYTEDPLYYYHNDPRIQSGNLLVSIYGGYTANTEFEYLTGHSMAFLPNGSVAYEHYINDTNCDSIVSNLKDENYDTIALHPYYPDFWARDRVYECFGFDQFYSIEDFKDPIKNDFFIKDVSVRDKIIEQFEQKGENPLFTFAVTMENHVPHTSNRTPHIFPTSDVDSNLYETVAGYASNVSHADQMFEDLVNYFEGQGEPTIVVMFGDHQPSFSTQLNPNYEYNSNYKTTYMVYANFDTSTQIPALTSPSFLSSYIYEMSGLPMPFYMNFNLNNAQLFEGYNTYSTIDANGETYISYEDMPPTLQKAYSNHRLLMYDQLFGKRYLEEILSKK